MTQKEQNIIRILERREQEILRVLGNVATRYDPQQELWETKMLHHKLGYTIGDQPQISIGAIHVTSILDNILATLLNIDPEILAKEQILRKYILNLWEKGQGKTQDLEAPMLEDKVCNILINKVGNHTASHEAKESRETENIPMDIQPTSTETEETPSIKEVEMEDQDISESIEAETIKETVQGTCITENVSYNTRNRIQGSTVNPYFIKQTGAIKLGVLQATLPGDNKEEGVKYLKGTLSIPKRQNPFKTEFINGNPWITFCIDEEEDAARCLESINKKEEENFSIKRMDQNRNTRPAFQKYALNKRFFKPESFPSAKNRSKYITLVDTEHKCNKQSIRKAMEEYGEIVNIHEYRMAFHQKRFRIHLFAHREHARLEQHWVLKIKANQVRSVIAQKELDDQEVTQILKERKRHSLKLYGVKGKSIELISESLSHTKAKASYIPRNKITLIPEDYAVIYFENEKDLKEALQQQICIENQRLVWSAKNHFQRQRKMSIDSNNSSESNILDNSTESEEKQRYKIHRRETNDHTEMECQSTSPIGNRNSRNHHIRTNRHTTRSDPPATGSNREPLRRRRRHVPDRERQSQEEEANSDTNTSQQERQTTRRKTRSPRSNPSHESEVSQLCKLIEKLGKRIDKLEKGPLKQRANRS